MLYLARKMAIGRWVVYLPIASSVEFVNFKENAMTVVESINQSIRCEVIHCDLFITGHPLATTIELCSLVAKRPRAFAYCSGEKMTGWKLYQFVYANREKNLILDNSEWIWKDSRAISVMRSLTETCKQRQIQWNTDSTGSNKAIPDRIDFENCVFVVAKEMPKRDSRGAHFGYRRYGLYGLVDDRLHAEYVNC